ncbi:MAG: hypothetical protein HKN76_07955 [Saprospiraceae bacterium]|nr:hypothetical protein [Saprospiraceae bacterium]
MQEANKFYSSQAGDEGYKIAEQRISFFLSDTNDMSLDLSGLNLRRIPKSIAQSEVSNKLKELNLAGNGLDDIKLLAELSKLEVLRLNENNLSNVQPLAELRQLHHLDLSENQIHTVTKMAGLGNLRYLNLRGNQIVDLPEQDQTILEFLDLSNNHIKGIDFVTNCPNLSELRLEGNEIEQLDPISGCLNLQILDLSRNQIRRLDPISNLVKLKHLFLQKNHLKDLSPLSGLLDLIELNLSENKLQEIQHIDGLNALEILLLNKNEIEILDHIPANLRVLELRGNGLKRIGSNFEFRRIERLEISLNNLTSFPLALGDKLINMREVSLRIGSNPFLKTDKGINQEAYRSENGKDVFMVFLSDYQIKKTDAKEAKTEINLPAKIILLGNSDVGKTTLANYLTGKKVKPGEIESTRILNIMNWKIDATG